MVKFRLGILLLALCVWSYALGREYRSEIRLDFRLDNSVVDPKYGDNTQNLAQIADLVEQFTKDTTLTLRSLHLRGSVSPEGITESNRALSRARMAALESLIREQIDIPDSLITRNDSYISWESLREKVAKSVLPYKEKVLEILNKPIDEEDDYPIKRISELRNLDDGRVWLHLMHLYFPEMRNATAIVTFEKEEQAVVVPVVAVASVGVVAEQPAPTVNTSQVSEAQNRGGDFCNSIHLKTNALGLGLLLANAAIEVDITRHLSLTVPIYYSAVNYFVPTIKFRTFATQPELRYWINKHNTGFFAGAHFGVAAFNLAVDGKYRYQDHDGKNPLIGGGISLGYRMPLSKNERWNFEFVLGVGGYSLYCDKFYNVENGKLIETFRKAYWGIDNAAINISYRFNLKKRKEEKR